MTVRGIWERRRRIDSMPFAAGGLVLTAVFWTTLAVFVVALWLTPVLPFGDYNYHLALGSILQRISHRGSVEAQLYESNLFSYNSGFQILVAALSFVMPAHYAGLVIFSGFWIGLALAIMALLRALGQPTERAFVVFPAFTAIPVTWGFTNYCISLAAHLYVLARVIRRPRNVPVPIRYDVVTGLIATAALFSHLMATGLGLLLVFVALVVRTIADRSGAFVAYVRTVREGLPFIPLLAIAAIIYKRQEHLPPSRYPDILRDSYASAKLKDIIAAGWDYFADLSDQKRVLYAIVILVLTFLFRAPPRGHAYPTMKGWLFVTAFIAYLLTPDYYWRTAIVYQRLPMVVLLMFAVALPRAGRISEKVVTSGLAAVGMWCALAFLDVRRAQLPDLRAFQRVMAEAPPGRSITIDAPHNKLEKIPHAWGGQFSAYYIAARRGLESSVTYANVPSNPVHYKEGKAPTTASDAVAQGVERYNAKAAYARHFDLVLVRTLEEDPAKRLWGKHADAVRLLSHHGAWWLFDARPYFEGQ